MHEQYFNFILNKNHTLLSFFSLIFRNFATYTYWYSIIVYMLLQVILSINYMKGMDDR